MTEEQNTTTTEEERAVPCFVRHEDAGGKCHELSVVRVYGLGFCERHGKEVQIGAASEEAHVVSAFVERLHGLPGLAPVERALTAAQSRPDSDIPTGTRYRQVLRRAYPNPPEELVRLVREWILDEHPGYEEATADYLMHALYLMHKLMRTAYEEGGHWIIERLEEQRESLAAQAAVALEELERAERTTRAK